MQTPSTHQLLPIIDLQLAQPILEPIALLAQDKRALIDVVCDEMDGHLLI